MKGIKRAVLSLILGFSFSYAVDTFPPSFSHPGDLPVDSIPQFICFGFDDNCYTDGMIWADKLFKDMKNPDGYPTRATFYISTHPERPDQELWGWIDTVYQRGHEIGNHTQTHHAETFNANINSYDMWNTEISGATKDLLTQSNIPADAITGFRTPFLGYSAATFEAMVANGLTYDCSIEHFATQFQKEDGEWGVGMIWPYTMEDGKHSSSYGSLGAKIPGFWQLPVHEFVKETGWIGVTGLDWNLWFKGYKKDEVVALWKSSLKVRMEGDSARSMIANRCPFFIGMHSDEYTDDNPANAQAADNTVNRRAAVKEFLDWAVTYNPAIRVVPMQEVIKWMKNPVPYSQYHYDPSGSVSVKPIQSSVVPPKATIRGNTIELTLTSPVASNVQIYTLTGRAVHSFGMQNLPEGTKHLALPTELATGTYLLVAEGVIKPTKFTVW